MQEAWIDLECPGCGHHWEVNPADLPAPGADHVCDRCGERRSMREFPQTARDLDVLKSFQED